MTTTDTTKFTIAEPTDSTLPATFDTVENRFSLIHVIKNVSTEVIICITVAAASLSDSRYFPSLVSWISSIPGRSTTSVLILSTTCGRTSAQKSTRIPIAKISVNRTESSLAARAGPLTLQNCRSKNFATGQST